MKNTLKSKPAKGNRRYYACELPMTKNEKGKRKPIILTMAMGYKKGKLGFDIKTGDTEFLAKSQAIAKAIRLDEHGFYEPMFDDIDLLDEGNIGYGESIVNIKLGGLGRVGKKNTLKTTLKGILDDALAYINKLARKDRANSETIVTGAKFIVHGIRRKFKKDLEAKRGLNFADVKLTTIAEKIDGKYVRALYNWQNSIDNGKTWCKKITTTQAKYTFENMKDIPTLFRKRSHTNKGGWSAWCAPVEITI